MYKILIVEDDNTIAERLASHLKKWNYKTVCVRDFKNVMEEFKKTDPQLVILDIGLPFYNGFYWCQEIRKLSNVPIIFLSSMNDNMNIVMAMNMGGDEFIEKPFDLNVVTELQESVGVFPPFAGAVRTARNTRIPGRKPSEAPRRIRCMPNGGEGRPPAGAPAFFSARRSGPDHPFSRASAPA